MAIDSQEKQLTFLQKMKGNLSGRQLREKGLLKFQDSTNDSQTFDLLETHTKGSYSLEYEFHTGSCD